MKNIILFLTLITMSINAWAGDVFFKNDSKRFFKIDLAKYEVTYSACIVRDEKKAVCVRVATVLLPEFEAMQQCVLGFKVLSTTGLLIGGGGALARIFKIIRDNFKALALMGNSTAVAGYGLDEIIVGPVYDKLVETDVDHHSESDSFERFLLSLRDSFKQDILGCDVADGVVEIFDDYVEYEIALNASQQKFLTNKSVLPSSAPTLTK